MFCHMEKKSPIQALSSIFIHIVIAEDISGGDSISLEQHWPVLPDFLYIHFARLVTIASLTMRTKSFT